MRCKFDYGDTELNYLKKRDKRLAVAIDKIGYLEQTINDNCFEVMLETIIIQQISLKAADVIWHRFQATFGDQLTPETILQTPMDILRGLGVSAQKAGYMQNCAQAILSGALNPEQLRLASDEQVTTELLKIKGVGKWTAEMVLIFSLGRKDILSYGDLTIIRGLQRLYHTKAISKADFAKYQKRYHPYGTIASFYLWYIAEHDWPQ